MNTFSAIRYAKFVYGTANFVNEIHILQVHISQNMHLFFAIRNAFFAIRCGKLCLKFIATVVSPIHCRKLQTFAKPNANFTKPAKVPQKNKHILLTY